MVERQKQTSEGLPSYLIHTAFKRKRTALEEAYGNALLELSQEHLELHFLQYVEGKSDEEIVKLLGVPLHGVRQFLADGRKLLHIGALAEMAHQFASRGDGFTISPVTAEPASQIDGYAVSLQGYEQRIAGIPSVEAIHEWIERYWDILIVPHYLQVEQWSPELNRLGLELRCPYIGGWPDGEYVLDVSVIIRDRADALLVAQHHGQKAIYHLATETEIYL